MDSCKSTSFDTVGPPTWKQMTWWDCCYFFSGAVQQPTGPHCFLLQVQIFFCSSLTPRRTSRWCTGVYLPCGQQPYRLAGQCQGGWDRRDRASPFRFLWAWGPGGWGLVFPSLSTSLPAPICSGQLLSDLSSFPIFWVHHILPPFPPFCLLPLAPSYFFLVSNLPPPFWALLFVVFPARCPGSGHRLCVLLAPGLFPLRSLQALLKLPLCIEDIWDWGRCCREKCLKSSLEQANTFSSVHVLTVWTLESSGQLHWTKKYK